MNEKGKQRRGISIGAMVAAVILPALLEIVWGSGTSLLVGLVFWTSLIEGSVALVAAGELCNARWTESVKRRLLCVYPLILIVALLFPLLALRMRIYPWADAQGAWLNRNFFIERNVVLLLLAFAAAKSFAASSIKNAAHKKLCAVVYLLVFVFSQSMAAFDWIMSLEYPWISTLFGGYFFVEALYAGIALSVLYIIRAGAGVPLSGKTLRDAATVLFGFSLLWAGLFYAQFLVIWYGNLPDERGFVFRRVYMQPYSMFARIILAAVFVVPFTILLSRRAKANRIITGSLAVMILAGMLLEKILFIHPAAPVPVFPTVLEFLCMGAVFILAGASAGAAVKTSDD
jgi:hypothetical protein